MISEGIKSIGILCIGMIYIGLESFDWDYINLGDIHWFNIHQRLYLSEGNPYWDDIEWDNSHRDDIN